MATLTEAPPDIWCAVEENGASFEAGATPEPTPSPSTTATSSFETGPLDIEVDRRKDSSMDFGSRWTPMSPLLPDRILRECDTYRVGDDHRTYDAGDGMVVEFTTVVELGEHDSHDHEHDGDGSARERTYFANFPSGGGATVAPVEYSVDGARACTSCGGRSTPTSSSGTDRTV